MLDLRSELTVFVITVGEPSLPDCIRALEKQDCEFRLEMIKNVAPMNQAFQQMLDRCKTPHFAQVDADMILYPHAIRALYEAIEKESAKTIMVTYPLHDKHLDRALVGVKIYQHEIAKQFPYQEGFVCEMGQLDRATSAGYKYKSYWQGMQNTEVCLGTHGTHYTPRSIFERYRNLFERYRLYPFMGWLGVLPQEFLARYHRESSELNFYALLGTIVGLTSDLGKCMTEKDFREEMPNWSILRKHFVADSGPVDLNLYITNKCNFECWFCRRQFSLIEESPDAGPYLIEKIMAKFPTIRSACIAGFGEPYLNPHLPKIVEALNEHGIKPSIITNGSLLKARAEELNDVDLAFISVSLNESNAGAHEKTHGVRMFDEILDGIREAVARGKHTIILSKVVTKQNYTDIPDFLALAVSLGAKVINLVNLLPHHERTCAEDEKTFWESVITEEDEEILRVLESYHYVSGAGLVQTWPIPISRNSQRCPRVCRGPWKSLGVDSRTFYTPCRRILPPLADYGSIDNEEVWHGRAFCDMRASVLGKGPKADLCAKCFANWRDY